MTGDAARGGAPAQGACAPIPGTPIPGGQAPGRPPPAPAGPLRFAVLGDSLSEGAGDRADGAWRGWAALLAAVTGDPASAHRTGTNRTVVPGTAWAAVPRSVSRTTPTTG